MWIQQIMNNIPEHQEPQELPWLEVIPAVKRTYSFK